MTPRVWDPPDVHGGDKVVCSKSISLDCAHIIAVTATQSHLVQDLLCLLGEESIILVEELLDLFDLG